MNKREKKHFRDFYRDAEEIKDDPVKARSLIQRVREKIANNRGRLGRIIEPVQIFVRMIRNYANGSYRQIPPGRVLLIIAAMIYLVSPFDAVFDFLPGGFIDDAAIFTWLFSAMRSEIEAYLKWENAISEIE